MQYITEYLKLKKTIVIKNKLQFKIIKDLRFLKRK